MLPGPAGNALRSLARVAGIVDVVAECVGAMLHVMSEESAREL